MLRDLKDLASKYPASGWTQAVARIEAPAVEEAPEAEVAEVTSDEDAA
jgi:hypothetical protein